MSRVLRAARLHPQIGFAIRSQFVRLHPQISFAIRRQFVRLHPQISFVILRQCPTSEENSPFSKLTSHRRKVV